MNYLDKNLAYFSSKGYQLSTDEAGNPYDQLISWSTQLGVSVDNLLKKDYEAKAERLKTHPIKLLVLDVDGVLTDGGMYYSENEPINEYKKFNAKDGMGILHYVKQGGQIAIISSGKNIKMIRLRAKQLGIQHVYASRTPKLGTLKGLCKELGIQLSEVAMIGDDINDQEVLAEVGLSACPADAVPAIKNIVDTILTKDGGKGCAREFLDAYLLQ